MGEIFTKMIICESKVNSELTSVSSTSEKKLAMALCNGPRKKMGGADEIFKMVNNVLDLIKLLQFTILVFSSLFWSSTNIALKVHYLQNRLGDAEISSCARTSGAQPSAR